MSESTDPGEIDRSLPGFTAKAPKKRLLRKPPAPPERSVREDRPLSEKQIEISKQFAEYKRIRFPPELTNSANRWWGWINSKITQIDREDAHAAAQDFGLTVDFNDPLEIIGALKYAKIVDASNKLENAKRAIMKGHHPYTVEDIFLLTTEELDAVTRDIALNHPDFEIDWGSV